MREERSKKELQGRGNGGEGGGVKESGVVELLHEGVFIL